VAPSEDGSISQVSARLLLWAKRDLGGVARVEYASEFSRQDVLRRLAAGDVEVKTIELPVGKWATEVIAFLRGALAEVAADAGKGGDVVVSVSGFAAAFQGQVALADSLRVLNFNREVLTAFPLRQIWWMTPVLLDTSLHAMPDMHGWFSPQLTLSEVVMQASEIAVGSASTQANIGRQADIGLSVRSAQNIDDAKQRGQRLLDELAAAQAGGADEMDLVMTYLLPALEAFASGSARKELRAITTQYEDLLRCFYSTGTSEVVATISAQDASADAPVAFARSLDRLVEVFYAQGLYAEAERLSVRSLDIKKRELGDRHPDTATSLNNLALLYKSQGRYGEAEPLYVQALEIRKAELGDRHPSTATSLNNLAGLYESQGRYSEAEPLLVQALEIYKAELGDRHPDTATSLNNLALLYKSQGRYGEAEPLYVQALEIRKAELGDRHPDTATSLNNLAELYRSQGRDGEAEPLLVQALEICKAELGDRHPDTAQGLNNLAELYRSQGRYGEAEPLYVQALEICKAELGDRHPSTASSLNNLAELYRSQGRDGEAEPLLVQALEIRKAELGDRHPDTATSLNNLALLYFNTKRLPQAAEAMSEALNIVESQLGPEHPYTIKSKQSLGAIQQAIADAS